MRKQLLPLLALLCGVALLLLGTGLLGTLLAIRGGIEGFDSQTLGAIGAMYFVGFLTGTYVAPRMIRRVGHVRAFTFFTSAIACAALLHELLPLAWAWAVLRLLTGTAIVGLYTTIESWLNSHAGATDRTRIFAVYMAVNLGALALSQQLLHLAWPGNHVLFVIAAICVCAAAMPVAATRLAQPTVDNVASLHLVALYRKAPVAVTAAAVSGLAQGAFWGLAAVWAGSTGIGTEGIAWFMTCAILGGALFQWPIGHLTDRLDRGHVITVVSLLAAGAAAALLLAEKLGIGAIAPAGFVYGGFAFALYPMAVARMMDRLQPSEMVSGSAGLLFLHGIGAIIGPLLAGAAMSHFGPTALPAWFVLTEGGLALIAWKLARRLPADIEQQHAFVPMVRTAATAFDMVDTAVAEPARAADR